MKFPVLILLISVLGCAFFLTVVSGQSQNLDLAIVNGRIVDGTGSPWYRMDLGIRNGRIVEIGHIERGRAARVIDAHDHIVAPGFIDVHAHIESNGSRSGIEAIPTADNYLQMGVTSVITGNCGGSAWPLGTWFAKLEKSGVSMNVGALIGHNNVRREGMGGDFDRPPTAAELEKMKSLVAEAMRDGAVGLSTGLIYVPGTFAKTDEVVDLAKVAARFGGIYATHMRDEANGVEKSITEALAIGKAANIPVEISHFKVMSPKIWGRSTETIKMVADARAAGQQVTVDQYLYTASSTSLQANNFPKWLFDGGPEKMRERLRDKETRRKVSEVMIQNLTSRGQKDFSYAQVASYRPDPSFNGKNISEITLLVRHKGGVEEEAEQMMDMLLAGGAAMVYHAMSDVDIDRIFQQPFTMVAADAGVIDIKDDSVPHPRAFGDNPRALGVYVREKKLVTLEDGIRKMTSLPAQTFGLWDRGVLRPGMAADIVVFDEKTIADAATYKAPKQFPTGIDYVIVNGKAVVEGGHHTGERPGKILYGPGRRSN